MAPQSSESRDLDKVIVRLPDGMRARLKEAASANGRSMNAEIVFRLENSFATKGTMAEKLKAIADGTFDAEPTTLDIFHADGFDASELNKVLREVAARIAVLASKVDALTERAD